MSAINQYLTDTCSDLIKDLIENHYLYQSVNLAYEFFNKNIRTVCGLNEDSKIKEAYENFFSHEIIFFNGEGTKPPRDEFIEYVEFPATIVTACEHCKGVRFPHNLYAIKEPDFFDYCGPSDQTYCFVLQCQNCKGNFLYVMVRRTGSRFRLVGRSAVEMPSLPDGFPKGQSKYFADAILAHRTGNTLAGVCLFRIALEQYLRDVTGNKATGISGDALYEAFKHYLPKEFPIGSVRGLGEVYGRLSEVMHNPDLLSGEEFDSLLQDVTRFFAFLKLMPLEGLRKRSEK